MFYLLLKYKLLQKPIFHNNDFSEPGTINEPMVSDEIPTIITTRERTLGPSTVIDTLKPTTVRSSAFTSTHGKSTVALSTTLHQQTLHKSHQQWNQQHLNKHLEKQHKPHQLMKFQQK